MAPGFVGGHSIFLNVTHKHCVLPVASIVYRVIQSAAGTVAVLQAVLQFVDLKRQTRGSMIHKS